MWRRVACCSNSLRQTSINSHQHTSTPAHPGAREPVRIPTCTPGLVCSSFNLRIRGKFGTNFGIATSMYNLIRGTVAHIRRHRRECKHRQLLDQLLHVTTEPSSSLQRKHTKNLCAGGFLLTLGSSSSGRRTCSYSDIGFGGMNRR